MFRTPYKMYSSHDEQKIAVRFWGQFKPLFSIFVNEMSKCYFLNFCVIPHWYSLVYYMLWH
jgi:hypothetical protein